MSGEAKRTTYKCVPSLRETRNSQVGGPLLLLLVAAQTWWGDLKLRSREEGGATAVEYALMVALIAAVIIVAVQALGNNASDKFNEVGTAVAGS